MHVIELNDAGLRIAGAKGVLLESPGYALLDHERLLIGEPALRESRLSPRYINHHFWDRLSLDPLPRPAPRARTQADLAYAHLVQLWEAARPDDNEVIFAVPGRFNRDQLALLLGIARESPFRAVGLVDLAVAAVAAAGESAGEAIVVDTQLHRTVITRLTVDAEVAREHVDDLAATALTSLRDAWIGLIADAFIRETRLDPFHDARTEQQLFDRLYSWLDMLAADGEGMLELEYRNNTFRVGLDQRQIVERARPRYLQLAERVRSVAGGARPRLLLTHRTAGLPGLRAVLDEVLRMPCAVLEPSAVIDGTLSHADVIRRDDERLAFVTRLPNPRATVEAGAPHVAPAVAASENPSAPGQQPAPTERAVAPTHVLLGERAWPLADGALLIGGRSGDVQARHDALADDLVCRVRRDGDGWLLEPPNGAGRVAVDGHALTAPVPLTPGRALLLDGRVRLELIEVTGWSGGRE
jgi:hypothetical protein